MKKSLLDAPRWLLLLLLALHSSIYCTASVQGEKLTLNFQNERLTDVISHIKAQYPYIISYDKTTVDDNVRVSVECKEAGIQEVMQELLADTDYDCSIFHEHIIIKERAIKKSLRFQDGKLFITGTVLDTNKSPIPGVNVIITNKGTGTISDDKGDYSIWAEKGDTLQFSFIGMVSQEIVVSGQTTINIELIDDMVALGEVVATGKNKRNVKSFSGTFIRVDVNKLKELSPNDLLQGLEYFDPSFAIVDNNCTGSDPNALKEFSIRGDASLETEPDYMSMEAGDRLSAQRTKNFDILLDETTTRPNTPLFVLDGFIVPMQRIVDLDKELIQAITILKDASATAQYGSRATNGVIVFETKDIQEGKININYANHLSFQMPDLTDYNLCDAFEKLEIEERAGVYSNYQGFNIYNNYLREAKSGVDTYWLSQPLRSVVTQNHSLNLSGGNKSLRYNMGVNIQDQPGVMKESERNMKSVNFSIQYRADKVNLQGYVNITDSKSKNSPYGSFSEYTRLNPYYRTKDEHGNYLKQIENKKMGMGVNMVPIFNPLYNTQFNQKSTMNNLTVNNNFNLSYRPIKNMLISWTLGYSKGILQSDHFLPGEHTSFGTIKDITKKGSYTKNSGSSESFQTSLNANYNHVIDKHTFSFMANADYGQNNSERVTVSARGFPDDNMANILYAYELDRNVNGNDVIMRNFGFSVQGSYMYDHRFAFDANLRGDISSRFGDDNRIAPFWSVGARYNGESEPWMPENINLFTITTSYGVTGTQNYDASQAHEIYTYSGLMRPYEGFYSVGPMLSAMANTNLGWSQTNNFSSGLNIGMYDNRVTFNFSYYNNITESLISPINIAPSTGFTTLTENIGEIQNKGYDIFVGFMPYRNIEKNIFVNLYANANHNHNEIKKISNSLAERNEYNLQTDGAPLPIYQEGYSTQEIFLVHSLGIDPQTGEEMFLTKDGERTFEWNASDKVACGASTPKLRGNINASVQYKDFSLNLGFQYTIGQKVYNRTLVDKIENINLAHNVDKRALNNRWEKPGDHAFFKKFDREGNQTQASTRFLMTKNELQFNVISLSYRMNKQKSKWLAKYGLSALSFNASTSDLVRFGSIRHERGIDYPFTRAYNLSISAIFN